MKILTRFALLLFLFTEISAFASDHSNAVLLNAGLIPFGIYEARFDKKLDKTFSISTMVAYYDSRKPLLMRIASKGYGYFLGFAPKFHLYGEAHRHSFFLTPHLNVGYMNHTGSAVPAEEKEGILIRVGASFGFAHVFSNGLALDLSAGLERYHQIYFAKKPTDLQTERDTGGLFRPTMSAAIGYAF